MTDIRNRIARRAAADLPEGAYVNLGIGIPTLVADHCPIDREVIFHSENGLLGVGPEPTSEQLDPELINAGKRAVTLVPGAAIFHHNDAFMMIRGGHIDYALLGAFQVAENGDLANWITNGNTRAPAVGGAMDLAVGARNVWVLMEHTTREGAPRILERCTFPLTAQSVVSRIYTELAVIDVENGLRLRDLSPGVGFDQVQALTGVPLLR
ncbi:3-oxoacid CoA-transferase subunit B [Lichenicoccus sp.]|uniref:3-oxoacid CoA-transferase subunit B n=1 Tax=Lichenicoccus sp. TaxID=2781899 RepID=UPI003D13AD33